MVDTYSHLARTSMLRVISVVERFRAESRSDAFLSESWNGGSKKLLQLYANSHDFVILFNRESRNHRYVACSISSLKQLHLKRTRRRYDIEKGKDVSSTEDGVTSGRHMVPATKRNTRRPIQPALIGKSSVFISLRLVE